MPALSNEKLSASRALEDNRNCAFAARMKNATWVRLLQYVERIRHRKSGTHGRARSMTTLSRLGVDRRRAMMPLVALFSCQIVGVPCAFETEAAS
jgi:hypothetical protein